MLQTNATKYDHKALLSQNGCYDREHLLTQHDVDKVNEMIALIEDSRADEPAIGDRVQYTNKYGDYYPNALIEKFLDFEYTVCESPYIPFVFANENGICLSVSGGGFVGLPRLEAEYVGKTDGDFKLWGHCGACGNGAVEFKAKVNLWEYADPNPLYGHFSTKLWRKLNFHKSQHPACDGYLYSSNHFMFPDEEAFQQFLNTYCGTVFPDGNRYTVWCYREEFIGIPRSEWNLMHEHPIICQDGCSIREVKVKRDYESHILRNYYVKAE